jgi:hypothetical protein
MAEINGITHGYDCVTIRIMGRTIGGIEGITYDVSESEPEAIYEQGSREPGGIIVGDKQMVDVTVDMTEAAYQVFESPARTVGKSPLDYWPFTITVSYADHIEQGGFVQLKASALHTDTLDQCKLVSVSKPNKRGDKKLTRSLKLKARAVR